MEGHPDKVIKSSSPSSAADSDSAIGTMSDLTPEEEETPNKKSTFHSEDSQNEIKSKLNITLPDYGVKSSIFTDTQFVSKEATDEDESVRMEALEFLVNTIEEAELNEGSLKNEEELNLNKSIGSECTKGTYDKTELKDKIEASHPLMSSEEFKGRESVQGVEQSDSIWKLNEKDYEAYELESDHNPDTASADQDNSEEENVAKKLYIYAYSSDSDSDKSLKNESSKDSDLPFKSEEYLIPVSSSNLADEETVGFALPRNDSDEKSSDQASEDSDRVEALVAALHINKVGIVEASINISKALNPFQGSKKESCQTIDQEKIHSTREKEGNDIHVENMSFPDTSNIKELDEHLCDNKTSLSPISKKTSLLLPTTLEEMHSITDSEEGATDSGEEEEMVVSASMQFTLMPSAIIDESTANCVEQEVVPDLSSSPRGVSIHVKHHEEYVSQESTDLSIAEEPSGNEGDIEDNAVDEPSPSKEPKKMLFSLIRPQIKLPDTVTRLTTDDGSEVFLVGTAHFSKESQEDVANTIRLVRPDIVMVELCKSRTAVLQLDEETILNESQSLNFNKVCVIFRQHGKVQGILYLLLLSVSAHITKQLGMAPGGEFRTAFAEAHRSAPGCLIQLGDRPIQVTLSRALASLSVWQKMKLLWHIMASKEPISKEEVEKCKQRDFIEEMLAEMTGQFPAISEVFVKERDIYLTKSLQTAAEAIPDPKSPTGLSPRVVVGVVGIGHVPGIVEHWGKIIDDDIPPIMTIPPPSLSDRVCKFTLKVTFYGLVGYGIYKCLPNSTKTSMFSAIENSFTVVSKYFVK